MRHYEIVVLVHPDQSDQAAAMAERYKSMIESSGGSIHRLEDWGRRLLAYPIDKIHKAHYFLMNIECGRETLEELTSAFRFNDAVMSHLVVKRNAKISEPSVIFQSKEDQPAKEDSRFEKASEPIQDREEETGSAVVLTENEEGTEASDIVEQEENSNG